MAGPRRWTGVARDYFILTKPTIILLLLITTVPAMVLAERGWPDGWLVVATLIGGILAAGGAGAVNMYLDRDIDAIMRRTRSRPVPAGRVEARHALTFGCTMGLSSGVWLYLTVNALSAALALAAFLFYTTIYTAYLKRTTVHNTVIGGAAGAAPPLIGWTAVTGELGLEGVLLFLLVFYWQPPHFWALALAMAEDYRAARIPMMPVVLGEHETKRQMVLYAGMTAALSLIFGVIADLGLVYLGVASFGGLGFIWYSVQVYRGQGLEGTRAMFRYSTSYLAVLFAAIVIDVLILG
ncbi:MAG: protoheme IX farnesyltransferase [Dehalococcoidia bacterium]|nr:protoheme IX farnesyltransferase [Dehalococcoidia bacterium]